MSRAVRRPDQTVRRAGTSVRGVLSRMAIAVCLLGVSATAAWAQPVHSQGPNFGTFSVGEVAIPLAATGGAGPGTYTWQVIGALPPGVSLRADTGAWPSWFPLNTSAALLGVATTPGLFNFTLQVTSGGQTTNQAATLRVSSLTVGSLWDLRRGYVGKSYSHQLVALNAVGPVSWSINSGSVPGLTLSPSGVLSGTPTTPGFYNLFLRLTDGIDTVFRGVNVDVHAIEITTPGALPNATQGVPYSVDLNVSGGTAPYTFSASSLPTGLALDADGTISGTPTAGRGPWSFTIVVTDALGRSTSRPFFIDTILEPQPAPRIQPYSSVWESCTLGWPCERGVFLFSGGTAPFTWTISGQPPGMGVAFRDWVTPSDLLIGGVATAVGDFDVEVTVTDALGISTTSVFPMHVSPLLQRWDWGRRTDLLDGTLDVPYTSTVALTGGIRPYSAEIISGQLPPGVTFDPATFTASGTPTAAGGFSVVIEYTDAVGETLRVFDSIWIDGSSGGAGTIDITSSYNLGTVAPGNSFSRTLFACCVPSYLWTALEPLPPGLTLTPGGVLSGTVTTAGTYSFLIRAADAMFPAANWAQQRFVLTVAPFPPTINVAQFTLPFGNVGTPYSVQLTATGGTGTLTWTLPSGNYLPPGLSLDADGDIQGTPTATGQFGFSVNVTDGALSGSRFLTLFIYAAGETPPLDLPLSTVLGPFNLGQLQIQLSATGGVPPYEYSLTPGATPIPGMRLQNGPPLPQGFTSSGFIGVLRSTGSFSSSIRVTDSAGDTLDRPFTLTVSPLYILSQTSLPRALVGSAYSFTFDPFGGTAYSWSASGLPPGISINSSGQVSGTPTAAGNYFSVINLTDLGTGTTRGFGYTLVVDPFAITTNGVLPDGVIGVPYQLTFQAPGCVSCSFAFSGALPSGLSFNAGVLSGTPTATTSGRSIGVSAIGSNGTVFKVFSIKVLSNTLQPLSIATVSTIHTTIGFTNTVGLFALGGTPPYNWSLESGSLPPGFNLAGPGETLSSSLLPGFSYLAGRAMQVGLYDFTLRVTDSLGATTTQPFTWNISPLVNGYTSLPVFGSTLTYNVPYSQPLLGLGGTGVYTWANLAAMPPGLALNPATGLVTGTPTNTGNFTVPMQLNDDGGSTFVGNISFNVAGPTTTLVNFGLGASLGTVSQGFSYSNDLLLSGGTGPYTVTALSALPPGFTLVTGDAVTSGLPSSWSLVGAPLAPGTFSFTLQATDSVGNLGARTFTITISPLSIVTSSLPDAGTGAAYSQPLVALGGSGAVTWSLNLFASMPAGLTLSPGGTVAGTPTQAGNYSINVVATDAAGNVAFRTLSLNVFAISITGSGILPLVTAGVPYSHTFTASGGASPLVWSAAGLPGGLTLSPGGVLSGTVSLVNGGTFFPLVSVSNGPTLVSRRFTLNVALPIPSLPNYPGLSTSLNHLVVGQAAFFGLTNPGGGVGPYAWSVAGGSSLPPGLALVSGAQVPVTFNPGTTLLAGVPTTAGEYTFDLVVTDSAGTQIVRTFTLSVTTISILPGLKPVISGVAFSQQFTTVGGTPPYTYAATPTSTNPALPPGLSLSSGGLLSGVPTSTGNYFFRLLVTDGLGRTFSRNYTLVSFSPSGLLVATNGFADATVGTGRQTVLQLQGSSAATWSVTGGSLPPGMSLIPGTGQTSLGGRPMVAGTYVFTLRGTNAGNAANFAERQFTFRVAPMQIVSPPVELLINELPAARVGVAYSAAIKMAGATPAYTFTPSAVNPLPAGLALSAGGVLSGTPTQIGTYTIGFNVADSTGATLSTAQLSLTVTAAGASPPLVAAATSLLAGSVGTNYAANVRATLDLLVRGGVKPFSWSVASGSSLPPGLSILTGGNGVSDVLGGIPSSPGSYGFSLEVEDAAGQVLRLPLTMPVVALNLFPDNVPAGVVGTAYSVTLTPVGTPSYSIQLVPTSDLPPGLTLNASGLLSGTPTVAGNFLVNVQVADSFETMSRGYRVTINNASGEAPAVRLSPGVIQVSQVQGSAGSLQSLTVNASSGQPFTAVVSGIPGASLSIGGGTTPATVSLDLGLASLAPGTYTGFVGVSAPDSTNLYDIAPITVGVLPAMPCAFTLSPGAASVSAGFGGGGFSVATTSNCSWTASSGAPWIAVTAGASGNGPGNVSYVVSPNGGATSRSGNITVNGSVYAITQFGTSCSFAINPPSLAATAAGGSATITIAASNAACSWDASGLGAVPSSGTGNGSVTITVPPNGLANSVVLNATIAGRTLTVNQGGVACNVGLSSPVASAPAGGGQGFVDVTISAGCTYDTLVGPSWISVVSGGSGSTSGTLVYNVAANSTTVARSGSMTIGGQTFQITQPGQSCSITIDTSGLGSPFGADGGVGTIGIAANGSQCTWDASTAAPWATVTPPSGSGNATVFVTVGSNANSTTGRESTLTVAGQVLPLVQSGTTCTFSLQSPNGSAPAAGGAGSVGVVAPPSCSWTAASNDASWLTVLSSGGTGSATVQFVAQANTSAAPRSGTLTVAGLTYSVSQAGAPCSYTLAGSGTTIASTGATGSVAFTASGTGCAPLAVSYASWLTVSTTFAGTSGTVQYTVAASPYTTPRAGTIQVGDATYAITQTGGQCGYSLNAYGAYFNKDGGVGLILGSPTALGCTPTTGTTQPTIITLDPLQGPVSNVFTQGYSVAPFSSLTNSVRIALIAFDGILFTVKQASW